MASNLKATDIMPLLSFVKEFKRFWVAQPGSPEEEQAEKDVIICFLVFAAAAQESKNA